MRSRGLSRAVATCAAVGGLLLTVTACQDSAATDRDASGAPAASASSTSPSESAVTVPEPTPSVEPADGPLIDVPGATLRGLKGYRHVADYGVVQSWGDGQSYVLLAPDLTAARSLDAFAKEFARKLGPGLTERQEDAVVAGQYSAWLVLDKSDPARDTRVFGVMYLDGAWTIRFSFPKQAHPRPLTMKERQEVVDRVLATFETHREDGQLG